MSITLLPLPKLDPAPLHSALLANPQLWDQHRMRTESPHSPHREVSDIWVRYNAAENFTTMEEFNGPHESTWYPAADMLHVKPLVMSIFRACGGTRLGGVLITKVPAGKQVYPHIDGGWHARYYQKAALQIAGNSDQAFCFEDCSLSALPGEIYSFDNSHRHWVTNPTSEDRITLIICMRND